MWAKTRELGRVKSVVAGERVCVRRWEALQAAALDQAEANIIEVMALRGGLDPRWDLERRDIYSSAVISRFRAVSSVRV
jgi:hypothetical protein